MNETKNEKTIEFEDWKKYLGIYVGAKWSLEVTKDELEDWFRVARQGMIPADRAVEIPEVWPDGYDGIRVAFGISVLPEPPRQQFIAWIPKPISAWIPRVGDPVFVDYDRGGDIRVYRFEGMDGEKEMYIGPYGDRTMCLPSERKPFDPAKIGKPWSEL